MCGATGSGGVSLPLRSGLSPRVRGNRLLHLLKAIAQGPIPACAGQPKRPCAARAARRAYPRVCGATIESTAEGPQGEGLSPRVRGNQKKSRARKRMDGPIPACAGQPVQGAYRSPFGRAYPRVCGATAQWCDQPSPVYGLSPRVRGNRCWPRASLSALRPIPACAGQPQTVISNFCFIKAYPRVCGATMLLLRLSRIGVGLSPRVRGNLAPERYKGLSLGPIPACAGQPALLCHRQSARRAYPRVCGATFLRVVLMPCWQGLSPRVRGNPHPRHRLDG